MTIVEGDPKVPFSIATTPTCREGVTPFLGLLHFNLDLYLITLSVEQGGIKYIFWVFGMTRPGIELRSPWPLANTLTIMPMSGIPSGHPRLKLPTLLTQEIFIRFGRVSQVLWHINLQGLFNAKATLVEEQKLYYLSFHCLMGIKPLWVI